MEAQSQKLFAVVGLGAVLPDALNVQAFWNNILHKCSSIEEVPPGRWNSADYYDPDPFAPDKTYSKIGGWVRGFDFDCKKYRIPPKVAAAMDEGQKWAISISEQALGDYGYPERSLDLERTAVVFGTAMGGEMHYQTHLRVSFPEYARVLTSVSEFNQLPEKIRESILSRWHELASTSFPPVTEDSMPGELPNIVSGRVANVFNLRGPNFITDAACAASFAATEAALELLGGHYADAVLTGGVDHNMGASTFVKFSKIGALSATGSRPFGEGADGFVMGEGAAAFLIKRLADAERDGDKIYAVIRGVGGASDGKGKGIYAPNPIGQQLAMRRAWENAGLDPATAGMVEAHGTSTKVGDVVEVESMSEVYGGARRASIALGSVKSNIGHLKAGAGAAGLLKAILALHHKVLPPTLNAERPNPNIPFNSTPFFINNTAREWALSNGAPRRCGVGANGFGGTNFHLVLEEHVPGMLAQEGRQFTGIPRMTEQGDGGQHFLSGDPTRAEKPLRGILATGAASPGALKSKLAGLFEKVESGWVPELRLPEKDELRAPERLVIDFGDRSELMDRISKALKALDLDSPAVWTALQSQGIFRGRGVKPGKLAFLFPGQGSQYLNMGRDLAAVAPIVAHVFDEADRVMTPILGRPLTDYILISGEDPGALKQAEQALTQTAITQPAVLALDIALYRLLLSYGFAPDMVMGHSLGEYAALIAAHSMPFEDTLEAAAARGHEMSVLEMEDNGWMAAVMAPYPIIEETLKEIPGYVVAANINSYNQCVIGGESAAVERAIQIFTQKGYQAVRLPVSHAFHSKIVAPASGPLRKVLDRLRISPPRLHLVSNVTGEFYPTNLEDMKNILQQQIASPVQWVKGLETLYAAGARVFIEVGPKKALKGFVDDVLGGKPGVVSLFTNHPKVGELASFNQALCGLYAAGFGVQEEDLMSTPDQRKEKNSPASSASSLPEALTTAPVESGSNGNGNLLSLEAASQLIVETLKQLATGNGINSSLSQTQVKVFNRNDTPAGSVVISGTGLGLPGAEKPVMDPENALRILKGEQFVDLIPERFRRRLLDKQVTRLVKSEDGNGHFEPITSEEQVIRLAGRAGTFDLVEEYGVPEKLVETLDISTQLAMAAGLDALREAGIPLVQTYRQTTTGKLIPDRWLLPEALRDETGVIFASAFPGGDRFANELERYFTWRNRQEQLAALEDLRLYTPDPETQLEIARRAFELRDALEREPYEFDYRFIFRILCMGHSQFAEYIGARGPNAHVNAACAGTTQGIALAEDWIRSGRCQRVVVISGDNVTSENLIEWVGAGLLALGALAVDDRVSEAALPFDRRRHGTILGMGACALVIESEDAVRQRGMRGIAEILATETRNSAYHGSRLDVGHIAQVMDDLITSAERRFSLHRHAIAPELVFISHETYTPARGGSASAEVMALRSTFGPSAREVVISNTKGFTGHPMGVGVEDVIAVKILEYGIVPPVPNLREMDPELGPLNLSRGGRYPVQYALHLAAGFGSQIAMTLIRRIPGNLDRIGNRALYARWLEDISGYNLAQTEVSKRVLRVMDQGAPVRSPAPSSWQNGSGPSKRSPVGTLSHENPEEVREEPTARIAVSKPELPRPLPEALKPAPQPIDLPEPVLEQPAITPPSPQPVSALDPVTATILAIVSEKTGYPQEMLDLDLDLEADLGIDTVKQAETFLAIREAFDIPPLEDMRLRDYPTLAHAIQFVHQMRPELPLEQEATVETEIAVKENLGVQAGHPSDILPIQDPVTEKILSIVSEMTGYPVEMLELDLDLEADLGIDTVKQAETFLAIRSAFEIPQQDDMKLRDYPTLAHAVEFVRFHRPDLAPEVARRSPTEEALDPLQQNQAQNPLTQSLPVLPAEAGDIRRRVPVPTLRPALAYCKPTGVVLDEKSRVIVVADEGGTGALLEERLRERSVTVFTLESHPVVADLEAQVRLCLETGPIQGVYWLPALDVEPFLEDLDLASWKELNQARVKNLYALMRQLNDSLGDRGAFMVSVTRMGGWHGYEPDGATAPLGGGVAGFTKAFKRERMDAMVKVLDFSTDQDPSTIAQAIIDETLGDPGALEVGYRDGLRYTITIQEEPITIFDGEGLDLNRDSIFVVTGAAGSITSAIVADLAEASRGTFYLLDRVPEPDAGDPYLPLFKTDREALKGKLIKDTQSAGERPTPAMVEKRIQAIEREEAALHAINSVNESGGKASYHSLDLLDEPAVTAVIEEIRRRHGRIDVLLHAAGVELSRPLAEKEPQQFDLVYDVKVDGFFNLLRAAKGMSIGATVVFSSVAGRFGNAGQTDYSAANDLLCKLTSNLHRWRPETRALAIDWTAWGGFGMATRGSIPKIMELAGIDRLPPEIGVPFIRQELARNGFRGELVLAGKLGILLNELDETGGLDLEQVNRLMRKRKPQLLMLGEAKANGLSGGLEVATCLDPNQQPFLYDHSMEGTPLLPGVMGIEAFAELAEFSASLLNGGAENGRGKYIASAVEQIAFLRPFKFYRNQPQTFYLSVELFPSGSGNLLARVQLKSRREPPTVKGEFNDGEFFHDEVHFKGLVRLTSAPLEPPQPGDLPQLDCDPVPAGNIYRIFFHGPAYRVLEQVQVSEDLAVGLGAGGLPPATDPPGMSGLMAPRMIELCFQAAGVWDIKTKHILALPRAVGKVTVYLRSEEEYPAEMDLSGLYAVVKPGARGEGFDIKVMDQAGRIYLEVQDYQRVQLPGVASL